MLRFDIAPVDSNAYRLVATVNFSLAAIYLFTPYQWVALIVMLGGIIRGFVSPHKCLSYLVFQKITADQPMMRLSSCLTATMAERGSLPSPSGNGASGCWMPTKWVRLSADQVWPVTSAPFGAVRKRSMRPVAGSPASI